MITQNKRNEIRQRIHTRIREKMAGTAQRPRLNVYRSLNHIYAQVIDDQKGETLVSASTIQAKSKTGGNVAAAKDIGKAIAEQAVAKGIKQVVFDRGGYLYHGRVK
ncbi:MAG: 50S ribosomal protein L18, partial [Terracidiphilus sp.]